MKKKLRMIVAWMLVSLILQFSAYAYLDKQVAKVIGPISDANAPITKQLEATVPGSGFKNIQVSYAKDYLAYIQDNTLKVFNLKKEKIVFEKELPANSDNSMGVLSYQWLPDRDTLLYFYAKKNPNPVTYVQVPITPPKTDTTNPKTDSKTNINSEDPNEKTKTTPKVEKEVPPVQQFRTEARYNNPQITELYTLELPDSDEDTAPDDRFNRTIDEFPAGGEIEEMVFSTPTGLIYLTIKNGSSERLMEIDIMKNVRTLNRSGETINGMAASDRNGTLFINSKIGGTKQIVSLGIGNRHVISKNANDRVLGVRDGKIYVGEVKDNELVKIKTTEDLTEIKDNPSFKTEWVGSIPFENVTTLIGSEGQVVINDQKTAYVVAAGKIDEIALEGDENFISDDGAELIQLEQTGSSTVVKLTPLKQDKKRSSSTQ